MTMKADRNTKNQNLVLESTDITARSGGSLFRTVLTVTPLRLNMVSCLFLAVQIEMRGDGRVVRGKCRGC
jgi:hypothetical protein